MLTHNTWDESSGKNVVTVVATMSAKLADYASHSNSDKMRLNVTVNFPLSVLHTGDMLSVDGDADAF